jgi:hypothetical protein
MQRAKTAAIVRSPPPRHASLASTPQRKIGTTVASGKPFIVGRTADLVMVHEQTASSTKLIRLGLLRLP